MPGFDPHAYTSQDVFDPLSMEEGISLSSLKSEVVNKHETPSTIHHAVFQVVVPTAAISYFEKEWLQSIYKVVSSWQGFLHREVYCLKKEAIQNIYAIIIHFDTLENFLTWQQSSERSQFLAIAKLQGLTFKVIQGK
jgi:antibiotic biosynthesis monooxygenase (ABM) superfamily enzyme